MTGRLDAVLAAIDAANAADPDRTEGAPAALLYGRRMSAELDRIAPDAPELLRIAARGQHIERWTIPRGDFPAGREGYLDWRRRLGAFHGARVAQLMEAAGYPPADGARVAAMLRKEGLKRDPQVQLLEDVICLVFLRHHFAGFAEGRDPGEIRRIVAKTARKMSAEGRARVRAEFDLPPDLAAAVGD